MAHPLRRDRRELPREGGELLVARVLDVFVPAGKIDAATEVVGEVVLGPRAR